MNSSLLSEQFKNGVEWLVLLPVRIRHRRRARARGKARAYALRAVRRTLVDASRLGAERTAVVFNVGMYVLLLDDDIAHFTDDLICAVGDRRRAFIAKYEAILLYEAAEDLPQLLGREFRDAVEALGTSEEQWARLDSVSSNLNRFKHQHREFLRTIRNVLAAHRDHDALRYANTLETLKPLEVMARAAELSELLEPLVGVITQLASLTADPAAIVRDIVASNRSG